MVNTYKDNPTKGLSKLQKNILVWAYGHHLKQEQEWEETELSDSVEILSPEDVERVNSLTRINLGSRQPPELRYIRIEENASYLVWLRLRPDFHHIHETPVKVWGMWKWDTPYFYNSVKRLEKRGLVKRFSSTGKRTTHVYLTAEGLEYSKELVHNVPTVLNS